MVEGVGTFPFPGGFNEGGTQSAEPRHNLSVRPFRPVAGALARYARFVQPLGLLPEPYSPLQVRGVSVEVLAEALHSTGIQDGGPDQSVLMTSPGVQAYQGLFQAQRTEGSQEKATLRGSKRR
jgi:hypothetical protein